MPTEVTDPTLLAQLNGPQEVTDPQLLAQLNGTPAASVTPAEDAYKVNPTFGNAFRMAHEQFDNAHPVLSGLEGYAHSVVSGTAATAGKLAGRVADLVTGTPNNRSETWGQGAASAVPDVSSTGQDVEGALAKGGQGLSNLVDQIPGANTPLGQTLKESSGEALQDFGLLAGGVGAARGLAGAGGVTQTISRFGQPVEDAAAAAADVPGARAATPPTFAKEAPAAPARPAPASTPETSPPGAPAGPDPIEAQRAATLKDVGLTQVRDSAVTGDKQTAATDYQQSKLDNEGGKKAAALFQGERDALGNHADALVEDAGGSAGLDETSLHNRGQTILQPLQDVSDALDDKISGLYKQADAQAKGMPLEMPSTTRALGDRASFTGTVEGQQLLRGVKTFMDQSGLVTDAGEAGNVASGTVQQAERLKQYLNQQWTPRTSRLIGSLKNAIDDDVTKAAGGDVYKQARVARAFRANLLDNPKGIASLLENSGPEGINRTVNVERIPDTVARMPVDQFGHVVDTLNHVAANYSDIAPQAQAALGEIRSQFMLRLQEQGQKLKGAWNNKGVTQYLNNNSAKLAKVFSPSELERMKTLNDAGHVLDVDRSYPGAAAQGHNLAPRIAAAAVKHGATALGAHLGGPFVAPVAEMLGEKGGDFIKTAAARRGPKVRKL